MSSCIYPSPLRVWFAKKLSCDLYVSGFGEYVAFVAHLPAVRALPWPALHFVATLGWRAPTAGPPGEHRMEFGVFDHLDRNAIPFREFDGRRLKFTEASITRRFAPALHEVFA
jgi:hypothetical protein